MGSAALDVRPGCLQSGLWSGANHHASRTRLAEAGSMRLACLFMPGFIMPGFIMPGFIKPALIKPALIKPWQTRSSARAGEKTCVDRSSGERFCTDNSGPAQ
jgi:hypothetical protein